MMAVTLAWMLCPTATDRMSLHAARPAQERKVHFAGPLHSDRIWETNGSHLLGTRQEVQGTFWATEGCTQQKGIITLGSLVAVNDCDFDPSHTALTILELLNPPAPVAIDCCCHVPLSQVENVPRLAASEIGTFAFCGNAVVISIKHDYLRELQLTERLVES